MAPALLGVSVAQISLLINTQIASHLARGRGVVADLCRPADGVPDRAAGRGAGRGAAAAAVGGAGRATTRGATPACSTGACAWWCCWRCPARWRCWCFPSRWWRCCTTTAPSAPRDVAQTVLALMGYGVGLMGLVGVKVLAPGFYARQDIRTPVQIAIGVLVLTQVMNLVFVPLARPRRAGAVDRPGRAGQRRLAADRPAAARRLPAAAGLGRVRAAGGAGQRRAGRACWPGPRRRIDWIGAAGRTGASAPAGWRPVLARRGAAVLRRAGGLRRCSSRAASCAAA